MSAYQPLGTSGMKNYRLYKRGVDLAILISAHIALLPVWLLLWALIPVLIRMEDRGPIFYRQVRIGKDGRLFTLRKFRTMVVNADKIGPRWNIDGDRRVTRVGRFLRRTALDELPGLISIWRGDMSFVGPRALDVIEHQLLERRIPGFSRRLQVSPGLTGLAQVYNLTDAARPKLFYDLLYIRRMSLQLDLALVFLSVRNTLTARWDRRTGKSAVPVPAAESAHPQTEAEPSATRG